jgi:hypothetical protein
MKSESKIIAVSAFVFIFLVVINLNSQQNMLGTTDFLSDEINKTGGPGTSTSSVVNPYIAQTEKDEFIGTWQGHTIYGDGIITFKIDNTVHVTSGFYSADGTWYITNGKLSVSALSHTVLFDYVFSNHNTVLTLTYGSETGTLTKV